MRTTAVKRGLAALAALLLAALALFWFAYRPWALHWGATDEEIARAMPGDDVVAAPTFNATRAVTIDAPPEAIWPWIIQIGYRRAGFYSYDRLDNDGIPSAERILPEYQDLKVGDEVPLSRNSRMKVVVLEPPRAMVWDYPGDRFSWAWGLYPEGEGRTRLVTRLHMKYVWRVPLILGYFMIDVGDFIMMRKCMLGIKRRAEAAATAPGTKAEA